MDNTDSVKSNSESEEDFKCYFLQPTSSPYNMVEKIQQANMDLLKSSPVNNKSAKVKFRDDLVSFEPDLTDDDVVSLESDHVNELPLDNITPIQYKTEIITTDLTNIFDIEEELEDNDEIIEEIETDYDNEVETAIAVTKIEQSTNKDDTTIESNTISNENQTISERSVKRKRRKSSNNRCMKEVNCKNHCLDKLDTNFSKLTLKDKPSPNCFPPLKLRERKCCLETKTKFLPTYNGLRSEYGLSRLQLENRQKHLMLMKEREQLREQLLNEYKKRRIEQNEAVFSQWLKNVASRRNRKSTNHQQQPQKLKTINRHCFTPNHVISKKVVEEERRRPKTANEICNVGHQQHRVKSGGRKRPNSMHTSVYIEVPERVLRLGLQVGDLLVTDNNLLVKKLHILSFS